MNVPHYTVTRAGLIALATTIIGQLVAFIPSFAPDKAQLISTASIVISAAFLLANAIHAIVAVGRALIATKVTPDDLQADAETMVKTAFNEINFDQIAKNLQDQGLAAVPDLVRAELAKLLGSAVNTTPAENPQPSQAPVTAPA